MSFKIVLTGNPNVGKSTIFNSLTGLKQHTGNWSGKTVALAHGSFKQNGDIFDVYDLPGTYSVISDSPEERIARDYICFEDNDLTVIVADATCIERNLNLALQIMEMTNKVLLCINLADEAKRSGVVIDTALLEKELGIPVVLICGKKRRDIKELKLKIASVCRESKEYNPYLIKYPIEIETAASVIGESLCCLNIPRKARRFIALKLLDNFELGINLVNSLSPDAKQKASVLNALEDEKRFLEGKNIFPVNIRDMIVESIVASAVLIGRKCTSTTNSPLCSKTVKIDKIFTSKLLGIPLTLLFFAIILWITIAGANYPSQLLSKAFALLKPMLESIMRFMNFSDFWSGLFIDGIYGTSAWITAVMLPPMAIFFPLFTLLEDLGFLPRIAFNLDRCFKCVNTSGKQSLTMCMGLGCNAVGVTGCRIISSPSERLAAILTNTFMPCNGRFGMLTTLSAIFIGSIFCTSMASVISSVFILLLIVIGVMVTLLITKLLTITVLKGNNVSFVMELPPYRRPQVCKILTRSLLDRTLHILGRALSIAAPAGAIIWLLSNIAIGDVTVISYFTEALDPFAKLMGMDGVILLAFLLALPANEIVLPIILMCYMSAGTTVDVPEINVLREILLDNNWTILTAINVMLFSLLHFPCATTLKTIKAETGSYRWTAVAFLLPTIVGIIVCMTTTLIYNIIT